jgi:hypothetical protein
MSQYYFEIIHIRRRHSLIFLNKKSVSGLPRLLVLRQGEQPESERQIDRVRIRTFRVFARFDFAGRGNRKQCIGLLF